MGNLANGVRSESSNVGAKCPARKSLAEAQSLKPSPAFRSGFWKRGIAKAPKATRGVNFRSSRRLMDLNLRGSMCLGRAPRRGSIGQNNEIPHGSKSYSARGETVSVRSRHPRITTGHRRAVAYQLDVQDQDHGYFPLQEYRARHCSDLRIRFPRIQVLHRTVCSKVRLGKS